VEAHCLLPRPPAHVVPGCRVHVQGEGGERHPRCAAHLQLCCRANGAAGAHRRPGALQRGQAAKRAGLGVAGAAGAAVRAAVGAVPSEETKRWKVKLATAMYKHGLAFNLFDNPT